MVREDITQVLGTLASGAAIFIQTGQPTRATSFRMLKSEVTAQITGMTANEQQEGYMLGIASGDLSLSEVEAALELNGPVKRADRVNAELAERPVWYVGRFIKNGTADLIATLNAVWNKQWTFGETAGWNWFVHNLSATAPTTGQTVRLKVLNFGVWVGS